MLRTAGVGSDEREIDGRLSRGRQIALRSFGHFLQTLKRETILSVGRRSAIARVAHLFCELGVRLQVIEIGDGRCFPLPIKQADVADATGLTPVHVNRMLKQLRDDGLLTFQKGEVVIHDWQRITRLAEFDPV